MLRFFLVWCLAWSALVAHKCVHSQIARRIKPVPLVHAEGEGESKDERALQAAWRPIRIKVDYSNVPASVPPLISQFFSKVIIPKVAAYYASLLSVTGPTQIPKISATDCDNDMIVPASYKSAPTNSDFVLFVKIDKSIENFLAWATACTYDSKTTRPNTGLVNINLSYVKQTHAAIESNFYTILHELMHALVFSDNLYDRFPIGRAKAISTQTSNGKTWTLVKTPGVVTAARAHFGCLTLVGVRLEDEGGDGSAGSHWEKNTLGNELMTAQDNGRPVISVISLHFLNDVGWYKVNFAAAERLFWGQGRGCAFVSAPGPAFPEFNVGSLTNSCTADFISKSTGGPTDYSNAKPLWDYQVGQTCNNGDSDNFSWTFGKGELESVGTNSRCFQIQYNDANSDNQVQSSACLKSSCVGGKPTFQAGGKSYICATTAKKFLIGDLYTVVCPNAVEFCKFVSQRPAGDCSGHGTYLVSGGCRCEYPFTGQTCAIRGSCTMGESAALCKTINPPTLLALTASDDSLSASPHPQ